MILAIISFGQISRVLQFACAVCAVWLLAGLGVRAHQIAKQRNRAKRHSERQSVARAELIARV